MKKIALISILLIASISLSLIEVANGRDKNINNELDREAKDIKKSLKLDDKTTKLVYNVLVHVKGRMDDVKLGTPNYNKLINYIDEERQEMMKVILPKNLYDEYDKLYSPAAKTKIQQLIDQNKQAPELIAKESLDSGEYIGGLGSEKEETEAITETKTEEKTTEAKF